MMINNLLSYVGFFNIKNFRVIYLHKIMIIAFIFSKLFILLVNCLGKLFEMAHQ